LAAFETGTPVVIFFRPSGQKRLASAHSICGAPSRQNQPEGGSVD
jgi:hypothetical protein